MAPKNPCREPLIRLSLILASVWIAASFAQGQTHLRLVRTEVVKHPAGEAPQTSVMEGGMKSLALATTLPGFTSRGNLTVTIPDRLENDQESFTITARLDGSWNLKADNPNINLGLILLGVPKVMGKGDPGPWLKAGEHTLSVDVTVQANLASGFGVRKWNENGKNLRSFALEGHTGVGQTLSGFKLTYVYEETKNAPAIRLGAVTVVEVVGEAEISPGGDDSQAKQLKVNDRVNEWDRLVTGMDSRVKLRFPDGTIVDVGELTDMKVACYIDAGNAVQTRLWLRGGEVSASVNKSSERPSSLEVKTPTAVCGVRGTRFVTRHNKLSGMTTVSVAEGAVSVAGVNPSLREVALGAGQSVDVSVERISAVRKS